MNCTVKVLDEQTNECKNIDLKNVTEIQAISDLECIAIVHDNGNKKKLLPLYLVKQIDCEDVKSLSLI